MNTVKSQKSGKSFAMANDGTAELQLDTGKYFKIGGNRFYSFTTAITANTTTTTAPVGSFAFTSHATGAGSIFRSDGAKWQYLTNS